MKAEWEIKPLGEVCDVLSGFAFKSADYCEAGHFLVRIGNVQDSELVLDKPKYVALDNKTKRFELSAGDILTSLTGNIGRVAVVKDDHLPAALNQRVARLARRSERDLDQSYFLYFLYSDGFGEPLRELSHGAAQQNVSPKAISNLPIPIPPLEEQKRIVAVLDAAFEGLARAKENAETNLQNARELFEGIARNIFENGESNWPKATLPNVCKDFGRGKSRHRPRNEASLYGGDYPFLQTGDLSRAGQFVEKYSQTYSEKGLAQSKLWPTGTVCIAIVGATIGESAITAMPACFPDSVIGMVPDKKLAQPAYVQHLLEHYMDDLKAAGEGSARDNINLATFENWEFPMPSVDEQDTVVDRLNQAAQFSSDLISEYTTKLTDIADLRQSLLQKAFAGELT